MLQDIRAPALINVGGRPNQVASYVFPCYYVMLSLFSRLFSPVFLNTKFRNYSNAGKLSYKEDNARGCFADNIDEGAVGVEGSLGIFNRSYR